MATSHPPSETETHNKMEVLVLGMCRTGTYSIKTALNQMGYKSDHMETLHSSLGHAAKWNNLLDAKFEDTERQIGREEFDDILSKYSAISDVPGACFGAELMAAYPDAEVILTTRSPDGWVKSMHSTIWAALTDPTRPFRRLTADQGAVSQMNMIDKIMGYYFYDNFPLYAKRVFLEHNDRIRALGAKHEAGFIEYQVSDWWGPLCELLGKAVPRDEDGREREFPRLNDTAAFRSRFETRQLWDQIKMFGIAAGVSAPVVAIAVVRWRMT